MTILAGTIVPVIPATNQPKGGDNIRYWIDTPELRDDCYGIGLYDGDFELLPKRKEYTLKGGGFDETSHYLSERTY